MVWPAFALACLCGRAPAPEGSPWQWLQQHEALLAWLFGLSIGSLVLTVLLLPVLVARLPADYFTASRAEVRRELGVAGWILRVVKNLLGCVFLLAGLAMLVLPGQGLLTILIALLLLDFPGKRGLELRLLRRPGVRTFLDRLRARRGQPPLRVD